jgi:hypothetical protein
MVGLLQDNLPAVNVTRMQAQESAQQSYGSIITNQ